MDSSLLNSDFLSILLPQLGAWALRLIPTVFVIIAELLWAVRSKTKAPLVMLFFSIIGVLLGAVNAITMAYMISSGSLGSSNFTTIQFVMYGLQLLISTLWGISFITAVFISTSKVK